MAVHQGQTRQQAVVHLAITIALSYMLISDLSCVLISALLNMLISALLYMPMSPLHAMSNNSCMCLPSSMLSVHASHMHKPLQAHLAVAHFFRLYFMSGFNFDYGHKEAKYILFFFN